MKTKRLVLMSCLTGTALIASPALGEPIQNKKVVRSSSTPTRMTRMTSSTPTRMTSARTMPSYSGTRYYGGSRYYTGGTRYYTGGNRYYGGGGTQYYSNGGYGYPAYGYYSSWPYTYWPSAYFGNYPSWDYYPYSYSYYGGPTYTYDGSVVAQVQRRLGELGYYNRIVDGVMGPMTRAYEATHNLVVDGTISAPLLATMGLS